MNYEILKAEVTDDPLARGYSGMSDQAVADSMNAVDRTVDREMVPTHDIYEAIIPAEYAA